MMDDMHALLVLFTNQSVSSRHIYQIIGSYRCSYHRKILVFVIEQQYQMKYVK